MTNGVIERESLAVRRVVRAIAKAPGSRTSEIGLACGWSESHTQKVLAVARADGAVHRLRRAGGFCGWYLDWQIEDARDAEAARRAELKQARNIRYEVKQAEPDADVDYEPIQRRVSQWGALPFAVSAPNFVFTWRPAA